MSRREACSSAAAIFALALVVRAIAAATVGFPIPEDTAYYTGVARNLVEGRGLISDALWSYQTQPLTVPRAAFEVWMPLPSLIAAVPMSIVGAAHWFRAAQLASVVTGSVLAVLAWRLGADVAAEMRLPSGRARTLRIGRGPGGCGAGTTRDLRRHARLDRSVRRPIAGCLSRDDPHRPWVRLGCADLEPPARGSRSSPRPGRVDPERGGLAGGGVACDRVARAPEALFRRSVCRGRGRRRHTPNPPI